jgi:hypothetical protein
LIKVIIWKFSKLDVQNLEYIINCVTYQVVVGARVVGQVVQNGEALRHWVEEDVITNIFRCNMVDVFT